jgi:hypothetical protein
MRQRLDVDQQPEGERWFLTWTYGGQGLVVVGESSIEGGRLSLAELELLSVQQKSDVSPQAVHELLAGMGFGVPAVEYFHEASGYRTPKQVATELEHKPGNETEAAEPAALLFLLK